MLLAITITLFCLKYDYTLYLGEQNRWALPDFLLSFFYQLSDDDCCVYRALSRHRHETKLLRFYVHQFSYSLVQHFSKILNPCSNNLILGNFRTPKCRLFLLKECTVIGIFSTLLTIPFSSKATILHP